MNALYIMLFLIHQNIESLKFIEDTVVSCSLSIPVVHPLLYAGLSSERLLASLLYPQPRGC